MRDEGRGKQIRRVQGVKDRWRLSGVEGGGDYAFYAASGRYGRLTYNASIPMGKQSEDDAPFPHRTIIEHAIKALMRRCGSMEPITLSKTQGKGGLRGKENIWVNDGYFTGQRVHPHPSFMFRVQLKASIKGPMAMTNATTLACEL
jgi:hypothetical protein